jgi:hypothetical protein
MGEGSVDFGPRRASPGGGFFGDQMDAGVRPPEQALQTAPAQIERRFRHHREFLFLQLEAQGEIVAF